MMAATSPSAASQKKKPSPNAKPDVASAETPAAAVAAQARYPAAKDGKVTAGVASKQKSVNRQSRSAESKKLPRLQLQHPPLHRAACLCLLSTSLKSAKCPLRLLCRILRLRVCPTAQVV